MPINITKMWDRYFQYYLDHFTASDISKEEGLPYLRDKLFISILLLTGPIGFLVYIPSIIVSLKLHEFFIGICDTLAIMVIFFIFFIRNQSIKSKKIWFSFTFYILAIILAIFMGIKGPSIIMLMCVSVLITLFQSRRAGLISVALNATIFLLLLALLPLNLTNLRFFQEFNIISWIGVVLNLVAFNTIAVLSVASLVDRLNESFLKEKRLQSLLMTESTDLLNAKHKAEESDRLKSAFLANMSHEIRTPMNGILGFSELLSEPELSGEDQQKYIGIIQKSGVRMLNILNEIVDISRIESGLMEVNFRVTNINGHIEYVYSLLKPEAEVKGIHLSFKNDLPSNDDTVVTDGEKLLAILINLVKNAIKYTDQGSIEFGYTICPSVLTGPVHQPARLEFFVKDTGIGIPDDRQEAIFDRFIQADIADIQAREGAGLGLSISRAYVEMMNGSIWVNSEPGKGSTFYFTIPYQVESVEKSVEKKDDLDPVKENQTVKLNMLIVEDDEVSRLFITKIVDGFSNKVLFAKSGNEAVATCRNNHDLDLILMDVRMPDLNGHEATRQIRQFNKDIIIIAQTAFGMIGDREKAIEAGCNDYISKPIRIEELVSLIQKHIGKKGGKLSSDFSG